MFEDGKSISTIQTFKLINKKNIYNDLVEIF